MLFKNHKKSTYQIAKETEISSSLLYSYLNGKRNANNMTAGTLYKLSKSLNAPMEEILLELLKHQKKSL